MITEKSFKKDAEMLSTRPINVFFIDNRSMAAIKMVNILIISPGNHLPFSIKYWIHVEFPFDLQLSIFQMGQ